MIIKIANNKQSENHEYMDKLFRVRYDEFVVRRKWADLDRGDQKDIDDYDDEHTSYVICTDIMGNITGGARIRPTTISHMLEEHFSFLSHNKKVPKGPNIGECSRTFVSRKAKEKHITFLDVLIGVVELSMEQNYNQLTGVLETWWLNSYLGAGLEPTPLGAPKLYNGLNVMGVRFDVDGEILAHLQTTRERVARAASRIASIEAA